MQKCSKRDYSVFPENFETDYLPMLPKLVKISAYFPHHFLKITSLTPCGSGHMFSVLAFYSNDPSLNPAAIEWSIDKHNKPR